MVGGIALLEKACHWRVGFVSEKPSPFPVLPPALLCSYGSRCKVAVSFSGCHVCLLPLPFQAKQTLLHVALAVVFYHRYRNKTKTLHRKRAVLGSCTCNPSTGEAEMGRSLGLIGRPA